MVRVSRSYQAVLVLATVFFGVAGCTSPAEYLRNGFKVGPNYCIPEGPVADRWIEQSDVRLRSDSDVPDRWWSQMGDETLTGLIECAAGQNLSLRQAAFRVLQARMQLAIVQGNLFPQQQDARGGFMRTAVRGGQTQHVVTTFPPPYHEGDITAAPFFRDQWSLGFNLTWELDLWGRLRRAVTSAESMLDASVHNYNDVLITLLGDVATTYVQVRTLQQRIRLLQANVELQRGIWTIARRRFEAGARNELDVVQAGSNLDQTESAIPQLQVNLRAACLRLCVLLGIPPQDLEKRIGDNPIPTVPKELVVGIPADLLRRRPDVRRAESLAAAQAEQIGIAEAALYPMFALNGTMAWQSENFSDLLANQWLGGGIGPVFQWNILNYGRLQSNVRLQDAKFQEALANYQDTVLRAGAEVEGAMVRFLRAQEVARFMDRSVLDAQKAAEIVSKQYKEGDVDFNRIALIEQNLVDQQDRQAQAQGEIVLGLIQVYRALGGGWEGEIPERTLDQIPAAMPPETGENRGDESAPMPGNAR